MDPKTAPPAAEQDPLIPPSYQRGSRAVEPPTIRSEIPAQSGSWMGNSSLLPNIGLTNRYDTSCVAIHESIQQIRLGICMVSGVTFLVIFFFWWIRFFQFKWDKLVVSFYLAFLAALLGVGEFMALMGLGVVGRTTSSDDLQEEQQQQQEEESANPWSSPLHQIQRNFGFLFHPVGKPSFLFLMATLCWALGGIWEFLLGIVYFLIAVAIVVLGQETEFRRNYYPELPDSTEKGGSVNQTAGLGSATWSYFSSSGSVPAEKESLLKRTTS